MKRLGYKKIAFLMAIVMMVTNFVMLPQNVDAAAADAGQTVVYQEYTNPNEAKAYFDMEEPKVAPTYKPTNDVPIDSYGYLFGGWFTKVNIEGVGDRFKAIVSDDTYDELSEDKQESYVKYSGAQNWYAKFVPAYISSVKCQNDLLEKNSRTEMRMVMGLDTTNYAEAGFEICGAKFDENGNVTKVGATPTVVKYNIQEGEGLYSRIAVYHDAERVTKHSPKSVLGEKGNYFVGHRLSVPSKNDGYKNAYTIRPFWVTLDGTKVYGLTKYAHIVDGTNGYINIPINLKNKNDVAAGVVEFDWSDLKAAGYTYMGAECGTKFTYLKVNPNADQSTIRCIVTTNEGVDVASDGVYMNLRFKKDQNASPKGFNGEFYHFTIDKEDFSDQDENLYQETNTANPNIITPYDVWNIQY